MTIFNLYIFDKMGTLMHYAEWNRTKKSGITREEVGTVLRHVNKNRTNVNIYFLFILSGSKAYIRHAILHQVLCQQNITTRSA